MTAYEKKRIYESYIDSGSKAGLFKKVLGVLDTVGCLIVKTCLRKCQIKT